MQLRHVFMLSEGGKGKWTEKVLHKFNGKDGAYPSSSLLLESGNLYGTTNLGRTNSCFPPYNGCGTVFELAKGTSGNWKERLLHSFSEDGKDGTVPVGGLTLDSAGNLYGTTVSGGTGSCKGYGNVPGCGTVFEITP